jgi:hypothetical protein
MAEVSAEISRWESLLAQEGDTRWESFTKAAIDSTGPASKQGVRFEDEADMANAAAGSTAYGHRDASINEQLTVTMEQLIEKNIQLTEEFEAFRERSVRELSGMEENAVAAKSKEMELQATLDELRRNIGDFLAVPSQAKERSKSEQDFWAKLATPSLLHVSDPPTWFGEDQSVREPPGKIVLPLSTKETDNFRASYQRLA